MTCRLSTPDAAGHRPARRTRLARPVRPIQERLGALETVLAIVRACGAEPDPWRRRWAAVNRQRRLKQRALNLVQEAVRVDPYGEEPYHRAMPARRTRQPGGRRTLQALSQRLRELELPFSPRTQLLAGELLAKLDAVATARTPADRGDPPVMSGAGSGSGVGVVSFPSTSPKKITFRIDSASGTPKVADFETYA